MLGDTAPPPVADPQRLLLPLSSPQTPQAPADPGAAPSFFRRSLSFRAIGPSFPANRSFRSRVDGGHRGGLERESLYLFDPGKRRDMEMREEAAFT